MDSSRALYNCAALIVLASLCNPAWAADAPAKMALKGARRPAELSRVDVALQVGGEMKLVSEGKTHVVPMSVVASLKYDEHLLALDKAGRPMRSVRYYDDARAVIKIDKSGEKPSLAEDRRLIAVEKPEKSPALLYSPTAALRREDLDLVEVPANSLFFDALLPPSSVAVGENWKLTDQALADLLSLEAVSWSDVQSVFSEIVDGSAEISAAGSVSGAVGGVATEIELKAKYKFDLKAKRVSYLALLVKEKRAVGHVGPGLDTVAKVVVNVKPLNESAKLTPEVVARVQPLSPQLAELNYRSPAGEVGFGYDRRWFLTSDEPKLSVFRYLDRGELVAQCNVAVLPPSTKKATTLAEFQRDVERSLGKNFGQFVNAAQTTTTAGYHVYRVVATGNVQQVPIQWVYYLIADDKGHKVSLSFTLEQSLEERFGRADRTLASQVRLFDTASKGKPTPATDEKPSEELASPATAARPAVTR